MCAFGPIFLHLHTLRLISFVFVLLSPFARLFSGMLICHTKRQVSGITAHLAFLPFPPSCPVYGFGLKHWTRFGLRLFRI